MDAVKVFDPWVQVSGRALHFDVMTGDQGTALRLANEDVAALGHQAITVTSEECQFCHQEPLLIFTEHKQQEYRMFGGFIVPLSS